MIKVNLNKTKSSVTSYYTQSRTGLAGAGSSIFTSIKETIANKEIAINPAIFIKIIINLILVLCFPLGLKIYEVREINKLENKKQGVEKSLAETKERFSQLESEIKSYGHLQEQAREFEEKKGFLKELAQSRLIIPQMMDLIQNKTPKTVWLEHLKMEITKDGNKLELSGKSFNETHVNFFASSLHDILDKNSITVDTMDIKEGNSVVKVDFKLQGVM